LGKVVAKRQSSRLGHTNKEGAGLLFTLKNPLISSLSLSLFHTVASLGKLMSDDNVEGHTYDVIGKGGVTGRVGGNKGR